MIPFPSPHSPQISPFTLIRWSSLYNTLEVMTVRNPTAAALLVSLDGIGAHEIVAYALACDGPGAVHGTFAARFPVYVAALAVQKDQPCFLTSGVAVVTVLAPSWPTCITWTLAADAASYTEALLRDMERLLASVTTVPLRVPVLVAVPHSSLAAASPTGLPTLPLTCATPSPTTSPSRSFALLPPRVSTLPTPAAVPMPRPVAVAPAVMGSGGPTALVKPQPRLRPGGLVEGEKVMRHRRTFDISPFSFIRYEDAGQRLRVGSPEIGFHGWSLVGIDGLTVRDILRRMASDSKRHHGAHEIAAQFPRYVGTECNKRDCLCFVRTSKATVTLTRDGSEDAPVTLILAATREYHEEAVRRDTLHVVPHPHAEGFTTLPFSFLSHDPVRCVMWVRLPEMPAGQVRVLLSIDTIDSAQIAQYALDVDGPDALGDGFVSRFPRYVHALAMAGRRCCFVESGWADLRLRHPCMSHHVEPLRVVADRHRFKQAREHEASEQAALKTELSALHAVLGCLPGGCDAGEPSVEARRRNAAAQQGEFSERPAAAAATKEDMGEGEEGPGDAHGLVEGLTCTTAVATMTEDEGGMGHPPQQPLPQQLFRAAASPNRTEDSRDRSDNSLFGSHSEASDDTAATCGGACAAQAMRTTCHRSGGAATVKCANGHCGSVSSFTELFYGSVADQVRAKAPGLSRDVAGEIRGAATSWVAVHAGDGIDMAQLLEHLRLTTASSGPP